jgi:hypothetical protein
MLAENIRLALANLRLREALQAMAMADALTGLPNRRQLEDRLAALNTARSNSLSPWPIPLCCAPSDRGAIGWRSPQPRAAGLPERPEKVISSRKQ